AIGGSKLVLRETPHVIVQRFMATWSKGLAVAAGHGQPACAGVVNVTVADAVREAAVHANPRLTQIANDACLDRAVGSAADFDSVAQAALDYQSAQDDLRGVLERHDGCIQCRDGHRRNPIFRWPEEHAAGSRI